MENNRGVRVISRIIHSQWLENIFLYEVFVALTADLLNQIPKQYISGISVVPLFSRLEFQGFVTETGHQFFRRRWRSLCRTVIGETSETWNPRCMCQQVVDGDFVPGRRRVGHVLLYRIVCLEFATLFKQQNAGGRELFRNRSEAELCFR